MAMMVFTTAIMIMMVKLGSGHNDDLPSDVRGVRLHPGHHWRQHAG